MKKELTNFSNKKLITKVLLKKQEEAINKVYGGDK